MTVPFIQEIVQTGLQLDADRYRALREKMRHQKLVLELQDGEKHDGYDTIIYRESMDDYLDTYIASQAANVAAPKEPEPTNMDAVWLPTDECTEAQKRFPVDYDDTKELFLIQWAMLTDEQKQKVKVPKR